MSTAEISQKKKVIDLRKKNNQSNKGLRTPDVDLDPDAPDSPIEVEIEDISTNSSNRCRYADVWKELSKESFGFNFPLAHNTFKTSY